MANATDYTDLALPKMQGSRSPLTYFKIILIPVLAYVFVVLGYLKIVNFKVELHTLIMTGFILLIALIFARHSATLAYAKLAKNVDDFKLSLKNFIMSNLLEISGVKKSNVGFDEFLDTYTRELRNDNLANIGTGVFPMLGILGTFISIAISMPSFSSSNTLGLEKEIGVLLNGVGTAFYVSVYGIFLALWWMFFEKLGQSKFENFIREQRDISREFFWQKNELEQRFMSLSAEHFDDIRSVFARISNEEFFRQLDNAIDNKFSSYKHLQELEQKIISEAQVRVDQNVRLLGKAANRQEEFIKANNDILSSIIEFNKAVREIELKFSTQYNRLNDIMHERTDILDKNISKFETSLKGLDLSLKNFSLKLLQEQDRSMQAFKTSIIEGIDAFKTIYEDEKNSESDNKRENLIKELKQSANELDSEVNRVIKNIENNQNEV
ncbi:MotA/TolQ/ExbB proton channel family protein [Campylobacter mucosalis]|uniref:MotA/TolQ/ExbB proton channel family protein n=1 Tax=Campylobacter mucosalis TaxID=202 RepID=UPI0014707A1B|nr:MotA/TolQ/ExbB proton channel family protein [Campylobacter mucosalis]